MCRTLLKPEHLMQKPTKGRLSRTSAWEQTESHAILRVNKVSPSHALHDDFPSSFFIIPEWCFIVLACRVCIPLLLGKHKYPPLCTKTSDRPSTALSEPSPHPSISSAPVLHGAPQAQPTAPSLLFDITLLRLSGPLCWLLSEADWRPFVCGSSCPEWPGGTCWAARGETGMRIWMGQCVTGTCWQRAGVPLWVLVHQRNHLVQLHVQRGVALPGHSHWIGVLSLQLWIFCCLVLFRSSEPILC